MVRTSDLTRWMILPRVDVTDVGVDCTWNGFSALEVLFRPGAVSFTFGTWRLEGEACIHGVTYWHTCSLHSLRSLHTLQLVCLTSRS